jgi:hypothetical protein
MTRKTVKHTKARVKNRRGTKARSSTAARGQRGVRNKSVVLAEVQAAHGFFPSARDGERAARALKRDGFSEDDISVFPVVAGKMMESVAVPSTKDNTHDNNLTELIGTTAASIAGSVLAVSSVGLATPFITALGLGVQANIVDGAIVVEVKTDKPEVARKAAAALLRSGGRQVGLAGRYSLTAADLKQREYRDAQGRIHHHTKTYLQDHPDEQPSLLA